MNVIWNSLAMCLLAVAIASGCTCCKASPKAAVMAEPAPSQWRGGIVSPSDLPVDAVIAQP